MNSVKWKCVKIGDVLELINGKAFKPSEWSQTGIPIVRIQNLNDFSAPFNHCQLKVENKYYIDNNELLFSWSGSRGTSFGSHFWNRGKAILNQHIFKIIIKTKSLDKMFCFYCLKAITSKIEANAHGSAGLVHITKNDLEQFEIPIPEMTKQLDIATALSSLDKAISYNQVLLNKLTILKKSLMLELFTKGIGHTKFKKIDSLQIPLEWNLCSLKDVAQKIGDGVHQSVKTSENGSIPFLYLSCIRENKILWDISSKISDETYKNVSKGKEIGIGTILYTAVGSYGIAAIVDDNRKFTFQRHLAYINPIDSKITSKYLMYWLNSPIGKRIADDLAVGNAQKTVTLAALNRYPVPVPTLSEQTKITEILEGIDNRYYRIEDKCRRLQSVKQAIMHDLFLSKDGTDFSEHITKGIS